MASAFSARGPRVPSMFRGYPQYQLLRTVLPGKGCDLPWATASGRQALTAVEKPARSPGGVGNCNAGVGVAVVNGHDAHRSLSPLAKSAGG
jgi:hypothetical protein